MIDINKYENCIYGIVQKEVANNPFIDSSQYPASVYKRIISAAWYRLLVSCSAFDIGRTPMLAEAGLAELVRRGLDMKKITIRGSRLGFCLNHGMYTVEKEGRSTTVNPVGYRTVQMMNRKITLSPCQFADFIQEFDNLIPSIIRIADEALLEERKKAMIQSIEKAAQMGGMTGKNNTGNDRDSR